MAESQPKNLKFLAFLVACLLAVAVVVTLIDLGIKASILEESAKIRKAFNGSDPRGTDQNGAAYYPTDDSAVSADVLGDGTTGVEAKDANPRAVPFPKTRTGTTIRAGKRVGGIPPSDEPMGA